MRLLQLRRERIAERMKALQELVPNANKVDQNFLSLLPSFSPFALSFEQSVAGKLSLKCGEDVFISFLHCVVCCIRVQFSLN